MEYYNIQFDQFQRYSIVAQIVRTLWSKNRTRSPRILEVGGNVHGNLKKFLPEAHLTLLDREPFSFPEEEIESLVGSGTEIPFPDSSFDFVVALDVLEHVENTEQEKFVIECCRVSIEQTILAFPSGDDASDAEHEMNMFWREYFQEDHPWLKEHFRNGLPELESILRIVEGSGLSCQSFWHGDLEIWKNLMKCHFLEVVCSEYQPFAKSLYSFYNQNLVAQDFGDKCYRVFVVVSKNVSNGSEKVLEYVQSKGETRADKGIIDFLGEITRLGKDYVELVELKNSYNDFFENIEPPLKLERQRYEKEYQFSEMGLELDKAKKENARLRRQLYEKETELLSVYATKSWVLTKSLREINQARRRLIAIKRLVETKGGVRKTAKLLVRRLHDRGVGAVLRQIGDIARQEVSQNGTIEKVSGLNDYITWVNRYDTLSDENRERLKSQMDRFVSRPLFSIIMPVFDPPVKFLRQAIDSVRSQLYEKWELCIADDASRNPEVREVLEHYVQVDNRIKVVFRADNGHISHASNSALELARGDFIVLMDHDDLLPEQALFWVANEVDSYPDVKLIYTDEDKIDEAGRRYDAYFKCDWNLDLFLSHNMFSHLGVYDAGLVKQVGGFRVGFEGSQDYDLVLRCIEKVDECQIRHIPRVLYHWRALEGSTAKALEEKNYAKDAGLRALNDYLRRNSIAARAFTVEAGYRVKYRVAAPYPKVSLVILTRDKVALLRRCIESITAKTRYPNYQILVVDNGSQEEETLSYLACIEGDSRVNVIRDPRPFNFSALNNLAVKHADGEIIGLVNNDVEVISAGWMWELVSHVCRPGVGAVGALLLYPDRKIQHAGVILGLGGIASHGHKYFHYGDNGYFGRAALLQSFSAVTGACLFVRKELYENVGGLNEKELKVAFNDIDFCLKLKEKGYRNVWSPYARLYHHESASRGSDETPENINRFKAEISYMEKRWGQILNSDPAYNPNLTLGCEDFSLAWPPRLETEV